MIRFFTGLPRYQESLEQNPSMQPRIQNWIARWTQHPEVAFLSWLQDHMVARDHYLVRIGRHFLLLYHSRKHQVFCPVALLSLDEGEEIRRIRDREAREVEVRKRYWRNQKNFLDFSFPWQGEKKTLREHLETFLQDPTVSSSPRPSLPEKFRFWLQSPEPEQAESFIYETPFWTRRSRNMSNPYTFYQLVEKVVFHEAKGLKLQQYEVRLGDTLRRVFLANQAQERFYLLWERVEGRHYIFHAFFEGQPDLEEIAEALKNGGIQILLEWQEENWQEIPYREVPLPKWLKQQLQHSHFSSNMRIQKIMENRWKITNGRHLWIAQREDQEVVLYPIPHFQPGERVKDSKAPWEKLFPYLSREYDAIFICDYEPWRQIQEEADEFSHLVLSGEERGLLNEPLPLFIQGHAGSGKSTTLFYHFARYAQKARNAQRKDGKDMGHPLLLSYSESLVKQAKQAVAKILYWKYEHEQGERKLPEIEEEIQSWFQPFENWLRSLLPEDQQQRFTKTRVTFADFADWFQRQNPPRELTAELAWYVIRTYIKGYEIDDLELSPDSYSNLPRADKVIDLPTYRTIWKIYQGYKTWLEQNGRWDDMDLAWAVLEYLRHLPVEEREKHFWGAIFCDEVQDFTRKELAILLELFPVYLYRYNPLEFGETLPLPFAFAGDPLQTLNPTGFRWEQLKATFYQLILQNIVTTEQQREYLHKRLRLGGLEKNYRSYPSIVRRANLVQLVRKILFGDVFHLSIFPQTPWWTRSGKRVFFLIPQGGYRNYAGKTLHSKVLLFSLDIAVHNIVNELNRGVCPKKLQQELEERFYALKGQLAVSPNGPTTWTLEDDKGVQVLLEQEQRSLKGYVDLTQAQNLKQLLCGGNTFILPFNKPEEVDKSWFLQDFGWAFPPDLDLKKEKAAGIRALHTVKGLEYSSVFLYKFGQRFCEICDRFWSGQNISFEDLIEEKIKEVQNEEGVRLAFAAFFNQLYVAITRAREWLWIVDTLKGYERFWQYWLEGKIPRAVSQQFNQQNWRGVTEPFPPFQLTMPPLARTSSGDLASYYEKQGRDAQDPVQRHQYYQDAAYYWNLAGNDIRKNECIAWSYYHQGQMRNAGEYFARAGHWDEAYKAYWKAEAWDEIQKLVDLNQPPYDFIRKVAQYQISRDIEELHRAIQCWSQSPRSCRDWLREKKQLVDGLVSKMAESTTDSWYPLDVEFLEDLYDHNLGNASKIASVLCRKYYRKSKLSKSQQWGEKVPGKKPLEYWLAKKETATTKEEEEAVFGHFNDYVLEMDQGLRHQLIQEYEQQYQESDSPEVHRTAGLLYQQEGQKGEALEAYGKAKAWPDILTLLSQVSNLADHTERLGKIVQKLQTTDAHQLEKDFLENSLDFFLSQASTTPSQTLRQVLWQGVLATLAKFHLGQLPRQKALEQCTDFFRENSNWTDEFLKSCYASLSESTPWDVWMAAAELTQKLVLDSPPAASNEPVWLFLEKVANSDFNLQDQMRRDFTFRSILSNLIRELQLSQIVEHFSQNQEYVLRILERLETKEEQKYLEQLFHKSSNFKEEFQSEARLRWLELHFSQAQKSALAQKRTTTPSPFSQMPLAQSLEELVHTYQEKFSSKNWRDHMERFLEQIEVLLADMPAPGKKLREEAGKIRGRYLSPQQREQYHRILSWLSPLRVTVVPQDAVRNRQLYLSVDRGEEKWTEVLNLDIFSFTLEYNENKVLSLVKGTEVSRLDLRKSSVVSPNFLGFSREYTSGKRKAYFWTDLKDFFCLVYRPLGTYFCCVFLI